jgi:hypothetical protein
MRKRLRKKLRRAEFTELVFGVRYTLVVGLATTAIDDFLDRFLEHAVEASNLRCGGGGQGTAWGFLVTSAGRGSPSEAQRTGLGTWLAAQPEVASYALGDFFDGWHGPEEGTFLKPGRPGHGLGEGPGCQQAYEPEGGKAVRAAAAQPAVSPTPPPPGISRGMKPRQGLFILDEPERAISSVKGDAGEGNA